MRSIKGKIVFFVLLFYSLIHTWAGGNSYLLTAETTKNSEEFLNISDVPLVARIEAPPPLLMLLIDDSLSMGWDVSCPENHGKFNERNNVASVKECWKSQYAGYNTIYYNPSIHYEPWKEVSNNGEIKAAADIDNPLTDPYGTSTRNLDSQFAKINKVLIPYAHYYAWSEIAKSPYLVTLSGSVSYYRASVSSSTDDHAVVTGLTYDSTPPEDILVSYDDQRQNFANWYTYYRTRQLAAKASLGKVVSEVAGIKLGLHTILDDTFTNSLEVQPIKLPDEEDKTELLLEKIYQTGLYLGTPLRLGLQAVGQYFDADDGIESIGPSPYATEDEGGGCQQAAVIMMTDGYYNGDPPAPSVGNADWGSDDTGYDGGIYSDNFSDTLADVAMYYYENDLSDSLTDSISLRTDENAIAGDTARHQHLITYTIAFGQLGGILTYNPGCPNDPDACPDWNESDPTPKDAYDAKIDQLWHAAINGRGDFLTATNTTELTASILNLIETIEDRSATGAAVSMSTQKIETGTAVYQTFFESNGWSGDLQAWEIGATDMLWSASEQLGSIEPSDRNILTFNGTQGKAFIHSELTEEQKELLNADELAFIRGDRTKESGKTEGGFRERESRLGDIVNSSPVFYNDMVFVGANDGMLHCFDAGTVTPENGGKEIFAYVPNRIFKNLKSYTGTDYTHQYYVDNTPYIGTVGDKSWLIGTLGKGGKGIFGIDITEGKNIGQSAIPDIWEYPDSEGDTDIGYTYSSVSILRTNATTTSEPVILFSNGYDSPESHAVLYMLKPDGTLFKKIDTEVGAATSEMSNGLSSPTPVDINFDGKVDYVYAGDLLGNLWKFDLRDGNPDNWSVAYKDGDESRPLFQAKGPEGNRQPIVGKPDVMFHCDGSKKGVMVVFGTGKYLATDDIFSTETQSVYGIWDWEDEWSEAGVTAEERYYGTFGPVSGDDERRLSNIDYPGDKPLTLLQQTRVGVDEAFRETTDSDINWFSPQQWLSHEPSEEWTGGTHVGWYFDLPEQGERVVSDMQINDGRAIFVSIIPSDSICSSGGSSVLHIIDACNGGQIDDAQFDTNGDGIIDDSDEEKAGKILGDIYYTPTISEENILVDKDLILETEEEKTGMFFWKLID